MPQRKDPDTPVKTAVAITLWPGVKAEKIEQLVTRKIEEKVAQNANVEKIRSISRTNISVVYVDLDENFPGSQIAKEFDDIALKLDSITDLPDGAGPITFIKDFGDTAALMLTVASPKVSEAEIDLRAKAVSEAIARHRAQYAPAGGGARFTIVSSLTHPVSPRVVQDPLNLFADYLKEKGAATDLHVITEPGFVGVDGVSEASDEALLGHTRQFISERLQAADFHPDSWPPVVIRDPQETRSKLGRSRATNTATARWMISPISSRRGSKASRKLRRCRARASCPSGSFSFIPRSASPLRPAARRPAEYSERAQHHAGRRSTGSRGKELFHRPFRRV